MLLWIDLFNVSYACYCCAYTKSLFVVIYQVVQNTGVNETCLQHEQSFWVNHNRIGETHTVSPTQPCNAAVATSLFVWLSKLSVMTNNGMSTAEERGSSAPCALLDCDAGESKDDHRCAGITLSWYSWIPCLISPMDWGITDSFGSAWHL